MRLGRLVDCWVDAKSSANSAFVMHFEKAKGNRKYYGRTKLLSSDRLNRMASVKEVFIQRAGPKS